MQNRLDGKLVLLYTLLVLQVFIVMIYVVATPTSELMQATTRNPVSFVKLETNEVTKEKEQKNPQPLYQTTIDEIKLKDVKTSNFFWSNNGTSCWREGVDEKTTISLSEFVKCACKQGWHGADCGQPEVVWRAIMASKQKIKLKPRRSVRRIIYTFHVRDYNSAIVEVIIEELYKVVDLFVICDFSNAEDNFKHKLDKGLLPGQQNKILYINAASKSRKPSRVISKFIWEKLTGAVKNIRSDDMYIMTEAEEILNWRALKFLKVYDGWPQPIGFRLRYSVFGFFWQHPSKTTINVGACTIGMIEGAHRKNSLVLQRDISETSERDALGLVIGDLNHYGGWYCQHCQSPANILVSLKQEGKPKEAKYAKNIDVLFIEDLIGTGVWLDGKTSLLRAYRSRDTYFAPETVLTNGFKYDWLVDNFYAKLDYY